VSVERAFCVWLTGLSGAGKSTLAAELERRLAGLGRRIVVFDGDAVRSALSADLGYGRDDRNENVARVAARAAAALDRGAIAICALMSPYAEGRRRAREVIGPNRFVLVYLATPLEVCESRDAKGLYARARRGEVRHVVGIDDRYERPRDADLELDTSGSTAGADVERVFDVLQRYGLISAVRRAPASPARA
jgi:adenylyl-sulfate kinase